MGEEERWRRDGGEREEGGRREEGVREGKEENRI